MNRDSELRGFVAYLTKRPAEDSIFLQPFQKLLRLSLTMAGRSCKLGRSSVNSRVLAAAAGLCDGFDLCHRDRLDRQQ